MCSCFVCTHFQAMKYMKNKWFQDAIWSSGNEMFCIFLSGKNVTLEFSLPKSHLYWGIFLFFLATNQYREDTWFLILMPKIHKSTNSNKKI